MINYCAKLEGNLILVSPSYLESAAEVETIPKWRIYRKTTKRLTHLSKLANNEELRLGFEFKTMPKSSIKTLTEAKETLKPLESQGNVGYVIDTFYFAKSNAELDQLIDIKEFIHLIQLCDLKYESESDLVNLTETDRLFPGKGDVDLKSFMRFTEKIRYKGNYSIEFRKNNCSDNLFEKFFKTF